MTPEEFADKLEAIDGVREALFAWTSPDAPEDWLKKQPSGDKMAELVRHVLTEHRVWRAALFSDPALN